MKHTDYYSAYKALDAKERQELVKAVQAHGGEYVFISEDDEDWSEKDFPIVIASFKYSDEQADYNVSRVTVDEKGCLTIFGFRKDYDGPEDENELYYIEFGHIGNITDYIPETEEVDNVTINNPAPILVLSPEDVENVGYSTKMTVSQFIQIKRLMEKSFEWNMDVYWDALKQACENVGIQKLDSAEENGKD